MHTGVWEREEKGGCEEFAARSTGVKYCETVDLFLLNHSITAGIHEVLVGQQSASFAQYRNELTTGHYKGERKSEQYEEAP